MLKALRRRLAVVYTLLAGIVLVAVSLACLRVAEMQLDFAMRDTFTSGVHAIIYKLQGDALLSHTWLSQTETNSLQVIYIEENGLPLSFQGAWQPQTDRARLIEMALAKKEAQELFVPLGSLEPGTVIFTLQGIAREPYLASVTLIPGSDNPQRLVVVRDVSSDYARIHKQRTMALSLVLAGLAAIAISGWLYSGHAVKPAELSNRRQVEFVSIASHELKSPLAVITASADALDGSENEQLLNNIRTESARMARLVDDLLLLSRADAKTWSLQKKPIEMDTLLIDCFELFFPVAKGKGIALAIHLPEEQLPILAGDRERLRQAISILLDNAVSYTPSGGSVELSASANERYFRISVSDSGPGIPSSLKERVFERFFRADTSHTDKTHTGLGLPIARELAHLHGGQIFVQEVLPHGARFIMELPIMHSEKVPI